jgi:flagellar hook-length control protein FliK
LAPIAAPGTTATESVAIAAATAAIEVAQAAAQTAGPVVATAADVVADLLATALKSDGQTPAPEPALTAAAKAEMAQNTVQNRAAAAKKADATPAADVSSPPAPAVAVDAADAPAPVSSAAPQTSDIPAPAEAPRLAAHVRGEVVSNAAVKTEAADASAGKTAPTSQGAEAASTRNTAPAASTSAFAAQVQAQTQDVAAPLPLTPDTVPTAQTTSATLPAAAPATPAAVNLSSLSRATIETTVQIAAQISRQLAGRSTRFEMGLTPEGLGKVNVSMDIDASGRLTAQLAFDNPLAAADLRARADELRGQLQDAGFTLTDDALSFTQQDASSSNGNDRGSDQRESRAFASASRVSDQADAAPLVPAAWVSLSLTPRGVDMKV